jgi:altronate hydrolase
LQNVTGRAIIINEKDKVAVALKELIRADTIPAGHKYALCNLKAGEQVIKYGFPIGRALKEIKKGQWVHTHNLQSGLGEIIDYSYEPVNTGMQNITPDETFSAYRRKNGIVGIRNEIWVIPTVGCVNRTAELIAERSSNLLQDKANLEGIYALKHPYGCSQAGEDHLATGQLLAALAAHPNAGAVLLVGLGCENNSIEEMKNHLGSYDSDRVKFIKCQEVEDEVEAGIGLVRELSAYACRFDREPCSLDNLTVGLKCGGSDAFSGITANPLVGLFSDYLLVRGGRAVLSEVPEMFGAETILMNRAASEAVFQKIVQLINEYKAYYKSNSVALYENPSPGNREGGITTLEEKALGCIQKGGSGIITNVLAYGDTVNSSGLSLLSAPGNDLVSSTALAAAGCQLILFTTGRGTPMGSCVPTVKIASNNRLYQSKKNWFDFNAGQILDGLPMPDSLTALKQYVLKTASGLPTSAERSGYREIALFKRGVIL